LYKNTVDPLWAVKPIQLKEQQTELWSDRDAENTSRVRGL